MERWRCCYSNKRGSAVDFGESDNLYEKIMGEDGAIAKGGVICPLSSRQAKYLKLGADGHTYMCGRFSMRTISLYISVSVCSLVLDNPEA